MAVSLLETFQTYLTPDVLQQISAFLGETPAHTETAVQAAVPALLAGLTDRMSTTLGSERVMSLINQVGAKLDVATLLGVSGGHETRGMAPPFEDLTTLGSGLLAAIFGSTLAPIVEALATTAGLHQESALSLLSLLTSIVLGVLGREVSTQHLGAASLSSLLDSERDEITSFVPASLRGAMTGGSGVGPGVGAGGIAAAAAGAGPSAAVVADEPRAPLQRPAWILPAAVIIILAIAAWYFFLRPDSLEERRAAAFSPASSSEAPTSSPSPPPSAPPAPAVAAPAPAPASAPAPAKTEATSDKREKSDVSADADADVPRGKDTSVRLPGGRSLKLEEGSASYQLDKFLAKSGDAEALPKAFNFERLSFESNSTTLLQRSEHMVSELAAILKAYPTVEVRIEGHTDSHGSAERNKTLSLVRAQAIKTKLVAAGIDASRITAEGAGGGQPIASNDNAAGRRHNRRIALVVTKR